MRTMVRALVFRPSSCCMPAYATLHLAFSNEFEIAALLYARFRGKLSRGESKARERGGSSRQRMGAASDVSLSKLALTGASASIAEGVTFPVDATKTRLQLQGELLAGRHHPPAHRSALGMGAHILQTEGVRGLYRGLAPGVVRHCVYSSSRICLYESFRNRWSVDGEQLPLHRRAAAGGTAGLIGQALASPADLVKVRMQADGRNVVLGLPPRYSGMVHALRSIVAENGLRGLYTGVAPNLTRAALVNIGELAAYDSAKQHLLLQGWTEGVHTHTASAVMSGFISTILSCPADVIKSRIMAGGGHASAAYSGMLDCLVKTVKHEGVTALWKGFLPCWARLGPWQFTFWVSPTPALASRLVPLFLPVPSPGCRHENASACT